MSTKSFALEIKNLIEELRDKHGMTTIDCANLITFLDDVIASPGDESSPASLEQYKAELQKWVEQHKHAHAYDLEMLRTVIASGQSALRNAFIMNSGAVIALLAFLGKLSEIHSDKMPMFAGSMLYFVLGAFLVSLAYGCTYLVQNFLSLDREWSQGVGAGLNIGTILLVVASYGLFLWGSLDAYHGFLRFK